MAERYDAVIVGSGPNGLAAAIELARNGRRVLVVEGADTIGGGTRTGALTLPGFRHDVCSAVHPLALASPFLRSLPLADHGLAFLHPPIPLAHPLDGGRAAALHRSLEETAAGLGVDAAAYRRLLARPVREWEAVIDTLLDPPLHLPAHPLTAARLAPVLARSAAGLARHRFRGDQARALFAGNAAHAMRPITAPATAAFGLTLQLLGHVVGWPVAAGGSSAITAAMASYLRTLGGEIDTARPVASLADLPPAGAIVLDVTPRQVLAIAGNALPPRYRRALGRFRYGPGVYKVDYALSGPVPWTAEACRRAGTVHVGGTIEEIVDGARPFVLVSQPSLVDETRAPPEQHALWAYCHVPNGSAEERGAAIDAQIERFAPGFSELVLGRHEMGPAAMMAHNPNYVGGDINGGRADLRQLVARPVLRRTPYATPNPSLFICSSSTPPGGGVHGMCGYHAARAVLRRDNEEA